MFRIKPGKWTGADNLAQEAWQETQAAAEHIVLKCAVYAASEVKKTLSGRRSGRTYFITTSGRDKRGRFAKRRRRAHIASAPGEPPAVLYGNLRNSIGWTEPVWDGFVVSAEFGAGLGTRYRKGKQDPAMSYARILELGGIAGNGARILPRPYIEPTAVRIEPKLEEMMRKAFR